MNMTIDAKDTVGVSKGDKVVIDMETQNVLGAAFIVYMVPLAVFLVTLGLSLWVLGRTQIDFNHELIGAGLGIIAMGLTFIVIRTREKAFKGSEKYLASIVSKTDKLDD